MHAVVDGKRGVFGIVLEFLREVRLAEMGESRDEKTSSQP
jgi:hypothetical protein